MAELSKEKIAYELVNFLELRKRRINLAKKETVFKNILMYVGKMPEYKIMAMDPNDQAKCVSKLLNISMMHALHLQITISCKEHLDTVDLLLTDPRQVFGDDWKTLFEFWWHFESKKDLPDDYGPYGFMRMWETSPPVSTPVEKILLDDGLWISVHG